MNNLIDARVIHSFLVGEAASHTALSLMAAAIYRAPAIAQFLEKQQGAVISPELTTALLGLVTWNALLLGGVAGAAGLLYLASKRVRTPAPDRIRDGVALTLGLATGIITGFVIPSQMRFPASSVEMNI